tara:strand:+ start:1998 stop:2204 length:207 start_codon:yes stop_codon:yes gene_type:complete
MTTQLKFWSTINREETQFVADMTQPPVGAMLDCVVLTGVHKGETRPFRWLNLNTLWEQQQEQEEGLNQ